MPIQIGNKALRNEVLALLTWGVNWLPESRLNSATVQLSPFGPHFPFWLKIRPFHCVPKLNCKSLIFTFYKFPGYCAYLMVDSERLGATATDGVWLRASVRNGRVGLRNEGRSTWNQNTIVQAVLTIAHHSAGAGCAAPRWIATVYVGNDGLDAIWTLVREGDC